MSAVVVKILGQEITFTTPSFGEAEQLFDDATSEGAHWPSITKKAVKLSARDSEGKLLFDRADLAADLGLRVLLEGGPHALSVCGLLPGKKEPAKGQD